MTTKQQLSPRSQLYANAGAAARAKAEVGKPRAPKGERAKLYAKTKPVTR